MQVIMYVQWGPAVIPGHNYRAWGGCKSLIMLMVGCGQIATVG